MKTQIPTTRISAAVYHRTNRQDGPVQQVSVGVVHAATVADYIVVLPEPDRLRLQRELQWLRASHENIMHQAVVSRQSSIQLN